MIILNPIKNTQHIYNLVDLCAQKGVRNAVLCPGSRCAPLLIGFGKHLAIETISINDERSAGFIALGLAQQSGKPVTLVCTSGTAAQNFAPAVTEAYYQNIPLIILTADRPREWIDQWDGQTIHQENLYEPHVKGSFLFDQNNIHVGEDALELALSGARGPVHLNLPIREPFYPDVLDEVKFAGEPHLPTEGTQAGRKQSISNINITKEKDWEELQIELNNAKKVLILGGQSEPNTELVELLNQINIPIIGDVISNLHGVKGIVKSADFIFKTENKSLKPDFLITIGRSLISKNLKLYLRKNKPAIHWHIGLGMVGDPFQSLTKRIEIEPEYFFQDWLKRNVPYPNQKSYRLLLREAESEVEKNLGLKLNHSSFNYFSAVKMILDELPDNSVLHLGNSMAVRIANFIGLNNPSVEIWCNRGTSGIDGTISTAVGHAMANPNRLHTLITGDLAFFYDRNGFWLNRPYPENLRIVVLNDGGGGIFNMIPGPAKQEKLITLFTTPHRRTAEWTAREFQLAYQRVRSTKELTLSLKQFHHGILEIFTDMRTNENVFNQLTKETKHY